MGGLIKLKEEDEELKRQGKGGIKSKVGPYIHGKTSRVGGPRINSKVSTGKRSIKDTKSSMKGSSGGDSNDRLSVTNSRQGLGSKHSLASGDKRTRAELNKV